MIERMKAWFLAGTVGAFSPPEFTFCVDFFSSCLFHSCITAMACKRPRSICQKGKWHVTPKHAYTLDPMNLGWVDYAVQTCLWNKPTRNSSVNAHSQSSQLAEPLWTDSGLKSWICVHKSWSPLKKKKCTDREWSVNLSSQSSHAKKRPPPQHSPQEPRTMLLLLEVLWDESRRDNNRVN